MSTKLGILYSNWSACIYRRSKG